MANCLIKDLEYRTKLALSGIPESVFYPFCNSFAAKYGRLPNLDEIPGVDSSKHITELLHLDTNQSTDINNLLTATNTNSPTEANIKLNDIYTDKDIKITPLYNEAIVDVRPRPSEYFAISLELHKTDRNANMLSVYNSIFNKLNSLYGILMLTISDKELTDEKWQGIPEVQTAKAFIHEGNIYINTDHASTSDSIHELSHLMLGSIRFKNPDLYYNLVLQATNFDSFLNYVDLHPNKTMSDNMEEVFVTEMSKYLAGEKSVVESLDEPTLNELHYGMKRLLDTVLMGEYSVKSIPDSRLYNMSLADLVESVNSNLLESSFYGSLNDALLHRMLSNTKSELMKKGDLKEECS